MRATSGPGRPRRAGSPFPEFLFLVASPVLIAALPAPDACAGDAARVAHYQPLDRLAVERGRGTAIPGAADAASVTTVSFEVHGRAMVLDLVRNDGIVAKLRSQLPAGAAGVNVYKGGLRSVAGSWARLSIEGSTVSGVIWDGSELLLIDRLDRLEGVQGPAPGGNRLALVRLADIELPIDRGQRAGAASTLSAEQLVREAAAQARQNATGRLVTSRAISLGIVIDTMLADSLFNVVQAVIGWANVADGIFTEQVDLHLDLEHILNLKGMPDPFTSTDPDVLLATLRDFKSSNPALSPLGLVHLLTRQDLDGETRGVAYLASACGPARGLGLTEARGSIVDALIMTHEIAHNLGAPHDNEPGSACQSTPDGFLMAPILNGSRTFSACSVNQMSVFLGGAACLTPVATSELRLDPPALPDAIYYKDLLPLDLYVHNVGLESVVDSELDISTTGSLDLIVTGASERDCQLFDWGPQQTCDLDNVYAGETVTVTAEILPLATGPQTLDITARAANDTDPGNNGVSLLLDVLAATDARIDGVNLTNANTRQGGSVTYSLSVHNEGDFDTVAVVSLQTTPEHTLSASTSCDAPGPGRLECDVGNVPGGASTEFEFEVHVNPDMGLGLDENTTDSIHATLATSTHNTYEFPDTQFLFGIWGAFYDLDVGFAEPPVSVDVGETGEFTGYVTNFGPDPVPLLDLRIYADVGVELGMPAPDRGTCALGGRVANCDFGRFEPGETVNVRVQYTGTSAGNTYIELFAEMGGGYETGPTYPSVFGQFQVRSTAPPPPPPPPPPPATGGGGGGGTSFPWLAALFLMLLRREASRPKRARPG